MLAKRYQPKWRITLDMLARARANGLGGTVLADSLFGTVTTFRRGLDEQGWAWCVGVESTVAVIDAAGDLGEVPAWSGHGQPPTRPARVTARVAYAFVVARRRQKGGGATGPGSASRKPAARCRRC